MLWPNYVVRLQSMQYANVWFGALTCSILRWCAYVLFHFMGIERISPENRIVSLSFAHLNVCKRIDYSVIRCRKISIENL